MKTLLTEEQLQQGVQRLADQIRQQYKDRPLTIVGVLIGSIVFLADLIRRLDLPMRVALVQARADHRGSNRPGPLVIDLDLLSFDIRGRDVLMVDDIFDTGDTLWELLPQIDELGPSSVKTAVLLRKADRCRTPLKLDFVGFDIPNQFVVGYGMDYHERYRNLPYLAVMEPGEMEERARPVKPLRVAIVTQRFWPLAGGPEKVLTDLAGELFRRGLAVTILTAQWQPQWPAELLFQDVPVVRLGPPPQGRWKTLRYMQSLARWLRTHAEQLDLVYVSQLRHEAYAALRAVGRRLPVVLRAERVGRHGDCLWQLDAPCGRRIKRQCMAAAALVAPTRAAQRELEAAGYPRRRIEYLSNGVAIPPPRTPQSQAAVRNLLAEAHVSLQLPERAFLAVCAGRLQAGRGLEQLLTAWRPLGANVSHARLWLAGSADDRPAIQRQIERLQLGARVQLIGKFDRLDGLLAAADMLVAPSPEGSPVTLLEAMAAGLPIVAIDAAANRSVLTDGQEGLLVAADDLAALTNAMARIFKEPDLAARLGHAARARAESEFSLAKMADQHVTWFEKWAQ